MAALSMQETQTAFRRRKPEPMGRMKRLTFAAHMLGRFKNAMGLSTARAQIIEMLSNCGCTFFNPATVEKMALENGLGPRDIADIAAKAAKRERIGGNAAAAQNLERASRYFRPMKRQ
jgi:hypothetical protein